MRLFININSISLVTFTFIINYISAVSVEERQIKLPSELKSLLEWSKKITPPPPHFQYIFF